MFACTQPLSHQQPKQRAIDPHYLIQDSFSQSRVTQLEVFDGDEACLSSSRDGALPGAWRHACSAFRLHAKFTEEASV